MKRTSVVASVLAAAMAMSLAACGSTASSASEASSAASESTASSEAASSEAASTEAAATDFDLDQDITVITRETGVEEKNDAGEKVDMTTEAAATQNSTNGVMTAVANDETAIGYISLGSLDDSV